MLFSIGYKLNLFFEQNFIDKDNVKLQNFTESVNVTLVLKVP